MSQYLFGSTGLINQHFQRLFSTKTFIFIFLFSCDYVIYSEHFEERDIENYTEETQFSVREPMCAVDAREKEYKKPSKRELIKYILMWSKMYYKPWREGKKLTLKQYECPYNNCVFTLDRSLFGNDITKFDAIVFDGPAMLLRKPKLPKDRSPRQKYIFYSRESADLFPICNSTYDGFFNWTMTYRLDSDISYSYFHIRNNDGEVVGPKRNMEWADMEEDIEEQFQKRLRNKTKAAAWFVSNCKTKSDRHEFVHNLQKHLNKYNMTVDVYGKCGSLKCPRTQSDLCNAMLDKDYYFYLALENSFDEDYVTEMVLRAMQNNLVPIVYGGANYSRFLPPGSYIDGRVYSAYDLADIMYSLTLSQTAYSHYFRWKNYYTYHDSLKVNYCNLCEALNNKTRIQAFTNKQHFRQWWNSDFKETCSS